MIGTSRNVRCDQCGAQAFARATQTIFHQPARGAGYFLDGELALCGHHLNDHRDNLIARGWSIEDQTHLVNVKPSPSASELD